MAAGVPLKCRVIVLLEFVQLQRHSKQRGTSASVAHVVTCSDRLLAVTRSYQQQKAC